MQTNFLIMFTTVSTPSLEYPTSLFMAYIKVI